MSGATVGGSGTRDVGRPTKLRIEHGPRSLGVGNPAPRLSWWLPSGVENQRSYEVETSVDGQTNSTGQVESDQSVLVPWPLGPLGSRSRCSWRVRVEGDNGWTAWSEPDVFEVGLLDSGDWFGHFIGMREDETVSLPRGERPALYARREFVVGRRPNLGRLYATAHGVYELFLDGQRVGDLELTPGFTSYHSHLECQTYDITEYLEPGDHTLVAVVSDGWWRGAVGFTHQDFCFGKSLALLVQLEIDLGGGEIAHIGTDRSWELSTEGPIVAADLMEGERVDLRVPFPPASGWVTADVVAEPDARLTASPSPPTRRIARFRPASIARLDSERQVVDFGSNLNGWISVAGSRLGPTGNRVRLRHGEMLGTDGDVDTDHLRSFDYFTRESIEVGQVDEVVSSGPASPTFEPRHTTHGFQYTSVCGADDLTPDDVTGILVHTDLERTGWFSCSDERLNKLHEAAMLSFVDNACEVPTDCPTRERAGWTGDWQIFVPAAAFLYDVAGFSDRWLRDLSADQWKDGRVANFAPDPYNVPGKEKGPAGYLTGSAGWGDAAVLVPYEMWKSYGDLNLLHRQYASMRAWVEFALARAAGHRHPSRVAARPEAAAHEAYLWDIGFHWGEWCEPGADPEPILSGEIDVAEIATAYLYRSMCTLAEVADLVGISFDARLYELTATKVREAWRAEFLDADGTVLRDSQSNLARALAFGLVDEVERTQVAEQLVKRILDDGTTVGTGFLATPFLLNVLADHGHSDIAYELLLQTKPPSWLYMVESGATTIWENWEGLDSNGSGSLNHYSKGVVVSFLHRYIAGLRPLVGSPAYRSFEVRPVLGGGITHAEARLLSPYGPIETSWNLEGDSFFVRVSVPPGTQAQVTLPDGKTMTWDPGTHEETGSTRVNQSLLSR